MPKKVEIHAVFTPLEQCYHFCKQRSVRQVSDEQFIRTHWNFRKIYIKLPKSFTETKKVEIICYRNNVFVAENLLYYGGQYSCSSSKSCHTEEEVKKLSMSTIQMHQSAEKLHKQQNQNKKIKTGNLDSDFQKYPATESQWTIPIGSRQWRKTNNFTHPQKSSFLALVHIPLVLP